MPSGSTRIPAKGRSYQVLASHSASVEIAIAAMTSGINVTYGERRFAITREAVEV